MLEKLEVQFLDRLVDIPGRGPWSSTGPVPWYGVDVPVVVQRQVPWPTLLAHAWLDSGYIFCVYLAAFWTNFTQFLREGPCIGGSKGTRQGNRQGW